MRVCLQHCIKTKKQLHIDTHTFKVQFHLQEKCDEN